VKYIDEAHQDTYVPVISHSAWKNHWEPLVSEKKLNWIWEIGNIGLELIEHLSELSQIQEEFAIMRNSFIAMVDLPPQSLDHYLDRIDAVQSVIKLVIEQSQSIKSANIG